MKVIQKILIGSLFLFMFIPNYISALEQEVTIHVFHGDGCGYCALEKEFLQELANEYENLNIILYETWYDTTNAQLLELVGTALDVEITGVPFTIIGDYYFSGYADTMNEDIIEEIQSQAKTPKVDVVGELIESISFTPNSTNIEKKENNNEIFGLVMGVIFLATFVVILVKMVSKEMSDTKTTVNNNSTNKKKKKKNKKKKKK